MNLRKIGETKTLSGHAVGSLESTAKYIKSVIPARLKYLLTLLLDLDAFKPAT